MRLPNVHGVIRRRLLVNFRVPPEIIQRQLPRPFVPKLHDGHAIAGICLIRLEEIRPRRFPRMLGLSSENAAHRIAVRWEDSTGAHEGVYIPRRDTGSIISRLAGGRLFPGEHQRATFRVADDGERIDLHMQSADGAVEVRIAGHTAPMLPPTSCFQSLTEASGFFEPGSIGYSATASGRRLDAIVLETHEWRVAPLAVDVVTRATLPTRRCSPMVRSYSTARSSCGMSRTSGIPEEICTCDGHDGVPERQTAASSIIMKGDG